MKRVIRPFWQLSLAVTACLVLTAATLLPRARDVIKRTFNVSPGETLFLDIDHGSVEVEVTDQSKVFIELERIAEAESKELARRLLEQFHSYEFEREADRGVTVRSRIDTDRRRFRLRRDSKIKVRLRVRVPKDYNINFSSGAGNVEITDVTGHIDGSLGAGSIKIEGVSGEVDIESGAGDVEIDGNLTRVNVIIGAGNVTLHGVVGEIEAMTGAGNLYAEIVEQLQNDSRLRTGAGNVVVSLAGDVSANLTGSTKFGNVSCEFPIETSKKFLSNSFSGSINGGGAEIAMVTAVGNVSVKRR